MAAYGAQLEQGKSPEEAPRLPQGAAQEHAGAGQVRPRVARDLQRRQGRRPDLLRERGDHRAEGRRGARLRDPGRDDPDPEPGRGDREGQVARQGEGVPGVPQDRRGAEDLRRPRATAASPRAWSTRARTRTRRSCSRSTSSAAGTRSTPTSSIRTPARWRRSSRSWVSAPPSDRGDRRRSAQAGAKRRPVRRAGSACAPARSSSAALSVAWLTLIVLIPLAAVVVRSLRGRHRRVLGRDHEPPGGRRDAAHARAQHHRRGDRRRDGRR